MDIVRLKSRGRSIVWYDMGYSEFSDNQGYQIINSGCMSLNAIYQLVLHIGKFKNLELNDQGHYMMGVSVSKALNNEVQFAKPYHFLQSKKELKCRKKHKIFSDPTLNNSTYQTKQFRIKYSDEEIDLQETVSYRLQLPTFPKVDKVKLSISLYYIDIHEETEEKREVIDQASFELCLSAPINNYSDVYFAKYKSMSSICVFAMMIDYKFRKYNGVRDTALNKERAKICSLEEYFKFHQKQTKHPFNRIALDRVKILRQYSELAKETWSKLIMDNQLQYVCKLPKYCLRQELSVDLVEVEEEIYQQYLHQDSQDHPNFLKFDCEVFQNDVQSICVESYGFIQEFLGKVSEGKLSQLQLKMKYQASVKQRFQQFILRNNISKDQIICDKFKGKEKEMLASVFRKTKSYGRDSFNYPIINLKEKELIDKPLLFHEITPLRKCTEDEIEISTKDLFVFCHGMGGKAIDMLPIRNMVKKICPDGLFLILKSNENQTDAKISLMGKKAATEISEYIESLKLQKCITLHFVGHSMGGIILRAAIQHLGKYKPLLGIYMSFSTPHLSYLKETNVSVQAGMWLLKKFRKNSSLNQLTMADSEDFKQSFMYKLSTHGSLKWFQKVILISSYEDKYVPWHSARIHQSQKLSNDPRVLLEKEMCENILQGPTLTCIHRIDISLDIAEKNFDTLIGRAAHIKLLSDQNILRLVRYSISGILS